MYVNDLVDRHSRLTSVDDMQRSASWSTTSVEYLTFMLNLGKRDLLLVPLIHGFVTIASVGSEMLVRNSRVALLNFLDGCSPDEVLTLRVSLAQIIQSEVPNGRLLRPGLEVFSFLLDVNPAGQEHTPFCQWRALLDALPQVHTSTDLPTLQALVGVYAGLLQYSELCNTALATIHRLLLHRYPSVRFQCLLPCSEAMLNATPDPSHSS